MRVLILGGGGREHAIGWKLSLSPHLDGLVSAPGNPGLARLGPILGDLDLTDHDAVADAAATHDIDLVVVGPEAPLAAGIADVLTSRGVAVCGPTAAAARLEASKSYAKDIMTRAGVATAAARVFTDPGPADSYLSDTTGPFVVKADGLAAGKGVLVTEDREAARDWARACLDGRFGEAGKTVIVEDYLAGPELSIIALCDGTRTMPLPVARDYKRVADGDRGLNTGGMGCYSPVEVPEGLIDTVMGCVIDPVIATLAADGIPYRGFFYAGLVLTETGPRVLEFNCRLGDPETQVVLPRLNEDLAQLLWAAATGALDGRPLRTLDGVAVDVVLGAAGYPGNVTSGDVISGIDAAAAIDGVHIFHAGTRATEDGIVTAGGRVLNVVGTGLDLPAARKAAYAAAETITFRGKHYRSDIARTP